MSRNLDTQISDEIRSMTKTYLTRRMTDVGDLERYWRNGELTEVAAIAHKLKGNGTGFGFPAITQIGGELETAAKELNREKAGALIAEFAGVIGYYNEKY